MKLELVITKIHKRNGVALPAKQKTLEICYQVIIMYKYSKQHFFWQKPELVQHNYRR
ncbi:hypothetical protein LguiA_025189 [Lonicera macranthoides]